MEVLWKSNTVSLYWPAAKTHKMHSLHGCADKLTPHEVRQLHGIDRIDVWEQYSAGGHPFKLPRLA